MDAGRGLEAPCERIEIACVRLHQSLDGPVHLLRIEISVPRSELRHGQGKVLVQAVKPCLKLGAGHDALGIRTVLRRGKFLGLTLYA